MTIFRLKQLAASSAHAAAGAVRWNYDRAELIADGVVHGIGVFGGLVAATVLVVLTAVYASAFQVFAVSVYVAGLLAIFLGNVLSRHSPDFAVLLAVRLLAGVGAGTTYSVAMRWLARSIASSLSTVMEFVS